MEQDTKQEAKERYMGYWNDQRQYYSLMSRRFKNMHTRLQTIAIIGATITPFLLNITEVPKIVPTVVSAVVAIATAVNSYYGYEENWRVYRKVLEGMRRERILYDVGLGHYKGLNSDEAFELFVSQSDTLLFEETPNHSQKEQKQV